MAAPQAWWEALDLPRYERSPAESADFAHSDDDAESEVRGRSLKWSEVDRSKSGPEVDRNGAASVHFRSTSGPAEAGGRTKWTEVDR